MTTMQQNSLTRERELSTIHPQHFTKFIYGREITKKLLYLLKCLESATSMYKSQKFWSHSTRELYFHGCEIAEQLVQIIRKYHLINDPDLIAFIQVLAGEDFFLHLHLTMFIPSLESLASEEQKQEWLGLAKDFRILGTYAQTELGHGSYIPGLETTATLDMSADEWVIDTPTMTSTKWWPGGLAKSCTHCILMARLIIKNKDYGVHPFLLQVRDLENHKVLPGIKLIHIGKKLGYNAMDNGAMQLKGVRIPRKCLLMRYYQVDKLGNYKKIGNQKLLYGTMTFTRKQIIWGAGLHLAKAVIIAIRYSIIRHQFPFELSFDSDGSIKTSGEESSVMEYSTQKFTLFPLLATSIAYLICGRWVNDVYNKFMTEAKQNNLNSLEEIHCITSSLKASMTMNVLDGMEACRKACGGHGYMMAAGIPIHLSNYFPQATYEGDFVVLSIQAGRPLLKAVERKMKQKFPLNGKSDSMYYIYEFEPFDGISLVPDDPEKCFDDLEWLLMAFKQRACYFIYNTAQAFQADYIEHSNTMKALDKVKIEMTKITKAHAHVLVLNQFIKHIHAFAGEPCYHITSALCKLYCLYWMHQEIGEFIISKTLSGEESHVLMNTIKNLLDQIRPHACSIADSFSMPDYLLNSALGRYDGNAYEALFYSTEDEPLNNNEITDAYYNSIQFILHPERKNNCSQINSKI